MRSASDSGRWFYGQDDVTLAGSLAMQLEARGLRVRILDAGGGGQFGALMLGDADGARVTREAIARPMGDWPASDAGQRDEWQVIHRCWALASR